MGIRKLFVRRGGTEILNDEATGFSCKLLLEILLVRSTGNTGMWNLGSEETSSLMIREATTYSLCIRKSRARNHARADDPPPPHTLMRILFPLYFYLVTLPPPCSSDLTLHLQSYPAMYVPQITFRNISCLPLFSQKKASPKSSVNEIQELTRENKTTIQPRTVHLPEGLL